MYYASLFKSWVHLSIPRLPSSACLDFHNAPLIHRFTSGRDDFVQTRGHVYIRVRLELGYDSHGPCLLLSAAFSSSAAPLLLHMPLAMYVQILRDEHELPAVRRLCRSPFRLLIPVRVLPCLPSPRSSDPFRQLAASHGTLSSSSGNTKVSCTPSTTALTAPPPPQMTFHSTPPMPPLYNTATPNKHSFNPARTPPPYFPLDRGDVHRHSKLAALVLGFGTSLRVGGVGFAHEELDDADDGDGKRE